VRRSKQKQKKKNQKWANLKARVSLFSALSPFPLILVSLDFLAAADISQPMKDALDSFFSTDVRHADHLVASHHLIFSSLSLCLCSGIHTRNKAML